MNCVVSGDEYFVICTLDELKAIVAEERNSIQCTVEKVLKDKFYKPSDMEKTLVRFLVEDGLDADDITPYRVSAIWKGMQPHFDWCSSMKDAYMDYIH